MASSLAVKRFLFSKPLLHPVASTTSRSFSSVIETLDLPDFEYPPRRVIKTKAFDPDLDNKGCLRYQSPGRARHNHIFSDVFEPFTPTRSLSQILNMVDEVDNPFLSEFRGIGAGGVRRGWDAKHIGDALHLRVDMPGLGKEDVKISVEQNILIIKGEGAEEIEEEEFLVHEECVHRFSSRIDLPEKLYKIDDIKAEMKNGVLKVIVPKRKEVERNDVIDVKVE